MFMKSELDLLIEHLQKEVDYLNSAMEEWDFKAAERYRKALIYTRKKLDASKSIKNPNQRQIVENKHVLANILRFEKKNAMKKPSVSEDELSSDLQERIMKRIDDRKQNIQKEIEKMKAYEAVGKSDDDKLYELLEELKSNQISQISIHVDKPNATILIMVKKRDLNTLIKSGSVNSINKMNISDPHVVDSENCSLEITIPRFIDKPVYQALQQIAQLFYEGLELSGDKTVHVSIS